MTDLLDEALAAHLGRSLYDTINRHLADGQRAEAERDGAYRERAHLVAWLAALHPTVIAPAPDIDEDGWQILYLYVGDWQFSWHIAPRDADLFSRVEHVDSSDRRAQWDGHDTESKYRRIRLYTRMIQLRGHEPYERCVCTSTQAGLELCARCPGHDQPDAANTTRADPEDTCRPVDIDGETIRVRGAAEMSDESQAAPADVIRAVKRKNAAEHPETAPVGLREQYAEALRRSRAQGLGGMTEAQAVDHMTAAVLAVRDRRMEQLAAGRETWKRKAEEIEQERDQLATLLAVILAEFRTLPGTHTATAHVETETLNRWRAALDQTQEQP